MITARDWGVDCIISLDADLQDDIAAIPEMVASYAQGNDIVYGVRNDRTTDTAFKRRTAYVLRLYALAQGSAYSRPCGLSAGGPPGAGSTG